MFIPPDRLQLDGFRLAGTLAAPAEFAQAEQIALPAPIAFSLRFATQGDRVTADGWVHTTVRVRCARCLAAVVEAVDREFAVTFVAIGVSPTEAEMELDARDLDVDYYGDDGLDLGPFLSEQVLIDLPMKLLCSDGCRGLCPQCGENRNRHSCDCEPAGDPRLSALAELRDRI